MSSFQAAGFPFAGADLTKAWISFKSPSLSVGVLLDAHRKNAAAFTTANQVAFDGLTALAEGQGDLIKSTVDDCGKATSDVLAAGTLEEKATKQADAARHIYETSVAQFRELSDIAIKANVAAAEVLNARITAAFDEFKALFAVPAPAPAVATTDTVPAAVVAEPVDVVGDVAPADAELAADAPPAPVEPEPTPDRAVTAAPKPPKAGRRPPSRR